MRVFRQIDRLEREDRDLYDLARCLSLAVVAEPELLRRVRLQLVPQAGPECEARLWFSELVESRPPRGLVFHTDAGLLLRERLALDFPLLQKSWDIVREMHREVTPALRVEEELRWWSHCGLPEADQKINQLLGSAALALIGAERKGLAAWAARALARLPERVQRFESARLLGFGAEMRLSRSIQPEWLAGAEEDPSWLAWTIPADHPRIAVGVRFDGANLEIGDPSNPDALVVEIPETEPLRLKLSWESEGRTLRRTLLFAAGETLAEPVAATTIELESAAGEIYHLAPETLAGREDPSGPVFDFRSERERHRPYFGFESITRELAAGQRSPYTVVTGGPASGKTALLCRVLDLLEEGSEKGDTIAAHHFLGAEPDHRPLLERAVESLAWQLERRFPALAAPGQPPRFRLRNLLAELSRVVLEPEGKSVLLVLGGLQHAVDPPEAPNPLTEYLPEKLPPRVSVLMEMERFKEGDGAVVIDIDAEQWAGERFKAFRRLLEKSPLDQSAVAAAADTSRGDLYYARLLLDCVLAQNAALWENPAPTLENFVRRAIALPSEHSVERYLAPFCFLEEPLPLEMADFLGGVGGYLPELRPLVREVRAPAAVERGLEERPVFVQLHHRRLRGLLRRRLPPEVVKRARDTYFVHMGWPPPEEFGETGRGYVVRHAVEQMLGFEEKEVLSARVFNLEFLAALLAEKGPARFLRLMERAGRLLGDESFDRLLEALGQFLAQDHPRPEDLPSMVFNYLKLFGGGAERAFRQRSVRVPALELKAVSLSASSMQRRETGHTGGILGCRLIEGGKLLSWSADATLRIWDLETLSQEKTLRGHQGPVTSCDGRFSASEDGTIRRWNFETGETEQVLNGRRAVTAVLHRPAAEGGPESIFVAGSDGALSVMSLEGVETKVVQAHEGPVRGLLKVSARPWRLLSWSTDRTLAIWDGDTLRRLATFRGHQLGVSCAFVGGASEQRYLFSGGEDHRVCLWDRETGEMLRDWQDHKAAVLCIAVDTKAGWIITGSADRSILSNRISSGRPESSGEARPLRGNFGAVRALALVDDRLVSGSDDGRLLYWNLGEDHPRPREFGTWGRTVRRVAFGEEDHGDAIFDG